MSRRTRYAVYAVVIGLLALYVGNELLERRDSDISDDASVRAGLEEFLAPWYEAAEGAQGGTATVVVVGDSISEGVLLPAPLYEHRYVNLLQDELRDSVGVTGGRGYLPAYYGDSTTPDDTVRNIVPVQEQMFRDWGLGGRAVLMPGGATLTYPAQQSTRVRVWYGRSGLFGGQGRVAIDGEDVTGQGTLSTGEQGGDSINSADSENVSGLWWTSPELQPGEHVVEVGSTAPDAFFVHTGVEFFDGDEESGIHVVDASHSGVTAGHFATDHAQRGHWNEVAALDPDLILVNVGTNPEVDYASSLATLVEHALAAAPKARVLLVDGYEPGTWTSEEWAEIRKTRQEVARAHPDRVAVFDLAAHWPLLAKDGSTSDGLMLEETHPVHPSVEGHARMAKIFAQLLSPSRD